MADLPDRIGVVGAGTMGAGIAQLGVSAGMTTVLYDPVPEALERGLAYVKRFAPDAPGKLVPANHLEALEGCGLVIEAAPEQANLKRELFADLSERLGSDPVLATNTSSILVTSIASAAAHPENVVGMHFFNPPPLMRLLEVIAAEQTGDRALAIARAVGEAMGKTVITVADGPGFLVNRCGRPFGGEALRLLQERIATVEQIDRIVRLGGGFRMGPFELQDLVGIDVGFAVAKSFDEQSFGTEPRWKPSMLQARKVAAGQLGRKTGRGWYEHPYERPEPEGLSPGGGGGRRVGIEGTSTLAIELRERATQAGYDARELSEFNGSAPPDLIVDASIPALVSDLGGLGTGSGTGARDGDSPAPPLLVAVADESLAERELPAVGFHALPPLAHSKLVELTRNHLTPEGAVPAAEEFFTNLGFHHEWVGDCPGLVLGRIVCQLVNEAVFAVSEGVGDREDVDTGLELGLNHPRGPFAWADAIGWDHVYGVVDGLYTERYGERYRPSPLLRRATLE